MRRLCGFYTSGLTNRRRCESRIHAAVLNVQLHESPRRTSTMRIPISFVPRKSGNMRRSRIRGAGRVLGRDLALKPSRLRPNDEDKVIPWEGNIDSAMKKNPTYSEIPCELWIVWDRFSFVCIINYIINYNCHCGFPVNVQGCNDRRNGSFTSSP